MGRPGGVTASAVVAIIGSLFTLLMTVGMIAAAFVETPTSPPPPVPIVIGMALFFTGLSALGVWTAVGLFRLHAWARTSTLVFAGFVAAFCVIALTVTALIPAPVPAEAGADVTRIIRPVMTVMFGIPLAIAVWWLIQFNTQATKAAFASASPAVAPARPLSISIIGWASIIGGVACLFPILGRMPVFLLGLTFEGWVAGVIYAFFGALALYIGRGLLELRERARLLAIVWYGISLAHLALVTLVPPLRHRMLDMQRALASSQPTQVQFDPGTLMNASLAFAALLSLTAIWFLVRSRPAFSRREDV